MYDVIVTDSFVGNAVTRYSTEEAAHQAGSLIALHYLLDFNVDDSFLYKKVITACTKKQWSKAVQEFNKFIEEYQGHDTKIEVVESSPSRKLLFNECLPMTPTDGCVDLIEELVNELKEQNDQG